jgi:hypothetical protein
MEILLVLALCIAAAVFFAVKLFSKKSQKPPQPPSRIDISQAQAALTRAMPI